MLMENGINTGVHYKPIHLYKCYGSQSELPVAEKLFPEILTLPLYPSLSDKDVSFVIDKIRTFYA